MEKDDKNERERERKYSLPLGVFYWTYPPSHFSQNSRLYSDFNTHISS